MMLNTLDVEQITCQRGDNLLFAGLSLRFQAGDFVQIEGRNGIGKTSLLRILTGLAQPLRGKVRWNLHEISQCREDYQYDLLYLGHLSGIKSELTVWENLKFYQQVSHCLQGNDVLWQALEKVGLLGYEDIVASQLSAGQQKRIGLARLWLSKAPLWILDEPFNAIDKNGVKMLIAHLEQHCQQGGIVIITSHQDVPSQMLQKVRLDLYPFYGEDE
ncbi:cytochrome c biogenesis heme-transporting ATPase CcmA [Lonepinella sp. BR2919]|uniref:cytochrome c biogenesis heme-transporting ATPase CcmA n=1 Tax=unclassified Lonepinella TaxID=2642006 RepID=UPI003F6DC0AF